MATAFTAQDPRTSSTAKVALGGEAVVATRWRTFGDSFLGSALNETDAWSDDSTGGGSAVLADGALLLSTSASSSAKGKVSGLNFLALLEHATTVMKVRARLPDGVKAGAKWEIGLESGDSADRIYFVYDGATALYARIEKATDADSSTETVNKVHDPAQFHDFEIQATKGLLKMLFDDKVVATFTSRKATAALIEQGVLTPFLNAENTTNDTDLTMEVDTTEIYREPNPWEGGRIQTKFLSADGIVFEGPGALMWMTAQQGAGAQFWNIYDGLDTNGTLIFSTGSTTGLASTAIHQLGPIECVNGCFVDWTGAITTGWFGYVR